MYKESINNPRLVISNQIEVPLYVLTWPKCYLEDSIVQPPKNQNFNISSQNFNDGQKCTSKGINNLHPLGSACFLFSIRKLVTQRKFLK